MKWTFETRPADRCRADALCLFATNDGGRPVLAAGRDLPALDQMVRDWSRRSGFKGGAGEVTVFPTWGRIAAPQIVVAGLGDAPTAEPWRFERAAATALRAARRDGVGSLAYVVPAGADPAVVRALVRGAMTGGYRFETFFSRENRKPAVPTRAAICGVRATAALRAAVAAGVIEGETLNEIADLANLPGNKANPESIAATARLLARRHGLRCTVWDERELARRGCASLLSVGRGSRTPPRLIVLEHRGRPGRAPVAIVGKTITFDSGGLSLKPPKSMELMWNDKSGGMAVLAAMVIAARLRIPRPVFGILAAAENMPGGGATRPGDIVRSKAGLTIEILNTDAEGRLVLADALAVAAERKPAAIVDLATLTGAVTIVLGRHAAAVLSTDDTLTADLRAAGEARGERLWPLPLWTDYDADLRSAYADLKNTGDGSAGTIIGGAFLKRFVPAAIPWAHIDIAGTAHDTKDRPYRSEGSTMFGARLLVEWLERGAERPTTAAGRTTRRRTTT